MNRDIAEKWIAALKSGDYSQGKAALQNCKGGFCCLGVLTDLYHKETGKGEWKSGPTTYDNIRFIDGDYQAGGYLSDQVQAWAEMKSDNGFIDENTDSLSGMNDGGASFKEIAKTIAKNVDVL